jgi:hypothetical protein
MEKYQQKEELQALEESIRQIYSKGVKPKI